MAGETILVVDDDVLVRSFVCAVLKDDGYTVVKAAGGKQALEAARSYPGRIDLLLTDVMMPHMRGTELAPLLLARRPGIPVVYMSSSFGDLRPTPHPLLEKPFTVKELSRAVRAALAQRQAA
jgi:two-component system, cell cycle sensor histidine kinase and response regulator CckA